MRLLGWDLTVSHDGSMRAAQHPENGSMIWSAKGLMGNAAVPPEVLEWLIRPMLRAAWRQGEFSSMRALAENPYDGEPPNKDDATS